MPRNVRPSWVDLSVDGRNNDIGTGPRRKDGTISARFFVRDKGMVSRSVRVETYSTGNKHELRVFDEKGNLIHTHITELD